MSTPTAAETAAGLRELADLCEARPDIGEQIGISMRTFGPPLHPKTITELTDILDALGETATARESGTNTVVTRAFGPVVLQVVFDAKELAGPSVVSTETLERDGQTVIREITERTELRVLAGGES